MPLANLNISCEVRADYLITNKQVLQCTLLILQQLSLLRTLEGFPSWATVVQLYNVQLYPGYPGIPGYPGYRVPWGSRVPGSMGFAEQAWQGTGRHWKEGGGSKDEKPGNPLVSTIDSLPVRVAGLLYRLYRYHTLSHKLHKDYITLSLAS